MGSGGTSTRRRLTGSLVLDDLEDEPPDAPGAGEALRAAEGAGAEVDEDFAGAEDAGVEAAAGFAAFAGFAVAGVTGAGEADADEGALGATSAG